MALGGVTSCGSLGSINIKAILSSISSTYNQKITDNLSMRRARCLLARWQKRTSTHKSVQNGITQSPEIHFPCLHKKQVGKMNRAKQHLCSRAITSQTGTGSKPQSKGRAILWRLPCLSGVLA